MLRSAFARGEPRVLAGVPTHERARRRHPRHGHDRHEPTRPVARHHGVRGRARGARRRRRVAARARSGHRRQRDGRAAERPGRACAGRPGCARRGSTRRRSSTWTTPARAAARPCTSPRWRRRSRTARCWPSASRRCGRAAARRRLRGSRTGCRRSTATTCTSGATKTTTRRAASSMGLNNSWAQRLIAEVGAHGAPDRSSGRQGVQPRLPQPAGPVPAQRDRRRGPRLATGRRCADPAHVQFVHRRGRRHRARRPLRADPCRGPSYHRLGGALGKRLARLPRPADAGRGIRLGGVRARAPRLRSRGAARRHRRRGALRPGVARVLRPRARPVRPPRPAPPASTPRGSW